MTTTWPHESLKVKNWNGKGEVRYAQLKLDGHRMTLFKTGQELTAWGRDRRPHLEMLSRFSELGMVDLVRWARDHLPDRSSIDCEVWTDGPASAVPSALRGQRPLYVSPFAVPWWEGIHHEYASLPYAQSFLEHELVAYTEIEFVDKDSLMRWAKDVEGVVLKEGNHRGWYKLKEVRSVDCVVTGTTDGVGKYDGLLGSLKCSAYNTQGQLVEIANVSGMSDDERYDMTFEDPVGRVVEIAYQYLGAGGRLRHPRFVRFRDDKPERECTM